MERWDERFKVVLDRLEPDQAVTPEPRPDININNK